MSVRGISFEKPLKPTRCSVCYSMYGSNEEMLNQFCACGCGLVVYSCLSCPTGEACLCFDDKRKCERVEEKSEDKN